MSWFRNEASSSLAWPRSASHRVSTSSNKQSGHFTKTNGETRVHLRYRIQPVRREGGPWS
jgi:hypothetical protein